MTYITNPIDVDIGSKTPLSIEVGINDRGLSCSINDVTVKVIEGEKYQGEYTITPSWQEQTLETQDKVMEEDVEILAIPYEAVTNEKGGLSVTIGGY